MAPPQGDGCSEKQKIKTFFSVNTENIRNHFSANRKESAFLFGADFSFQYFNNKY